MQACDCRSLTFEAVKARLAGQRLRVYDGYRIHGPCTTRVLSGLLQLSILSVRPRTTELLQIGFLAYIGREGSEGIYIAISELEARKLFERKQEEVQPYEQPQLKLS
jgi:hypothetical protein